MQRAVLFIMYLAKKKVSEERVLFKLSFPRIRRPTPYGSLLFTVVSVNELTVNHETPPSAHTFRHMKKIP